MTRDPIDALRALDPAGRFDVHGPPAGLGARIVAAGGHRRMPVPGWSAAVAAAVVVVVVGGGWMLWLGRGIGPDQAATTVPSTTVAPTAATAPESGISPAGTNASVTTTAVPALETVGVFFMTADQELAPPWESALIPASRVVDRVDVVTAVARALLAGPTGAEAAADPPLVSAIPKGTRLLSASVEDGVAIVDLSEEFASASQPDRALAQIVFTLTQIDGIDSVHVLVDGTPAANLPVGQSLLDDPATRRTYEGYQPRVMLESPGYGGTLTGGGTVTGTANVYDWRVGLRLSAADGTVLWETAVSAECLPGCRGEYDWAAFTLPVPVPVAEEESGVLTVFGFTEEGMEIDHRSHPVWLVPGADVDITPTTTTTTLPFRLTGTTALGAGPTQTAPLAESVVPDALDEAWSAADNREWCAAIFPYSIGDAAATVRATDWFAGGWVVVWDVGSGPGWYDSEDAGMGARCDDCGLAAFGLAGTTGAIDDSAVDRWAAFAEWDDGSRAGYGYLGDAAPEEGMPLLATIQIVGQGCAYQAWSFLGESHLLTLLGDLRFVDGMEAGPVTPVGLIEADPQSMGPPPWSAASVDASKTTALIVDLWNASTWHPDACPLLAPTDLGPGLRGAARSTPSSEFAVAWDLPSGPGRGTSVDYCADCGRSAFGYAVEQSADADRTFDRYPVTHTWDDGSFAWILPERTVFTGGIPDDLLEYRDGVTGEPLATRPMLAYLQPAGFGCAFRIWSFLGEDHLMDLIAGLRTVDLTYGEGR